MLARLGVGEARPFAVVHVDRTPEPDLVLLAKAKRYWKSLGIPADLVVLGGGPSELALFGDGERVGEDPLSPPECDFVDAAARLVVASALPELGESIPPDEPAVEVRRESDEGFRDILATIRDRNGHGILAMHDPRAVRDHGHFDREGAEYVVRVTGGAPETLPPAPWINVSANEGFGCLVSETGAGTTWSVNSREHRLTPWFNDPLRDPHGEAWYLRDDDTGRFGSPFPGPVRDGTMYEVRHGFGVSSFCGERDGFEHEVTVFVPHDASLKVVLVRVTNRTDHRRRVSLFAHQRLVLGGLPEEHGRFVVTSRDRDSGALLARSARDDGFPPEVVYAAVVPPAGAVIHATTDREAFVGRNGSMAAPAALIASAPLDGSTGAGLDACFAFQAAIELEAGEAATFGFLLGAAPNEDGARDCVARFSVPGALDQALEQTRGFWRSCWSGLRVEIPAPELEPLVNGWLPYQTLSCRIWGRSAFYQSGGAFGFRDQLQDAASLVMVRPELTRAQIVLHAGHQFVEGDVLHWWHPGTERGLRTRFADDLLWLPYVASHYVETTGDDSVLNEPAPYLHAPPLEPGEDEVYLKPEPSGESADVYDHCCRAIDRSLATGAHGLPLFGSGDWNDGMNRVGREGRGESVWMGFFLCSVLDQFAPLCRRRGEADRERRYAAHREKLAAALNGAGWDGAWYRRGFYDDGTPLGARESDECQIDALVQAWSVLSGVAPPDRAERCMAEVERRLISEDDGLIRLLTPPFDRTPHDPGYIKGYVPGVRENGGQYTHAALWVVRAFAQLGRRDRAARLLSMLSPITHTSTPERQARYRLEPYVVAADVYGAPPHVGRGGWSWYTGSSGWMYRVAIESVLGLSLVRGERLRIKPCIPDDWPGFRVEYTPPGTEAQYVIVVENPERCAEAVLAVSGDLDGDGVEDGVALVPLARHGTHSIVVRLGPKSPSRS
jgi:cellobiose phosphorylase